jgi:hypothetical protein
MAALGKLLERTGGMLESFVFEYGDDGRRVMVLYDFSISSVLMMYPWRASRTLWHRTRYKNDVKMIPWGEPTGVAKEAIERALQERAK